MRKFIVVSIVLLMIAGFAITSSAQDTLEVDLVVGRKHIPVVGELTVVVVGVNLVITYTITDPWELGETHLYIGTSAPTKSAPGQFPYGPESDYATDVGYTIPLDELPDPDENGNIFIAAQAEVSMVDTNNFNELIEETTWAWTEGDLSIPPGKNWATYFTFTVGLVVIQ